MPADAERLVEQAREADDSGDPALAEKLAKQALKALGKSPAPGRDRLAFEAHLVLAGAYSAAGMAPEAERQFEACAKISPDDPGFLMKKAWFRMLEWDYEAAQELLERCAPDGELEAEVVYARAVVSELAGDFARADGLYARAGNLDPDAFPKPFRISARAADSAVRKLMASLTGPVRERLRDVVIELVEVPDRKIDRSPDLNPLICGYFYGFPSGESPVPLECGAPGIIRVFKRNLERDAADFADVEEEIRATFYHEIGHVLGFDEDGLDDLGLG